MYDDKSFSVNWFKIGLRLVIALLICLLAIKVFGFIKERHSNTIETNAMQEKIDLMEKIGKEYFKANPLPENAGESITLSLKNMIEKGLIDEIKDTNNNACSLTDSYVRVIKLEKEYQYKTKLVCDNFDDFKNYFENIEDNSQNINVDNKTTTTTTKTSNKNTTKKVNTTKKTTTRKYKISFNTNGGSTINDQYVQANEVIISPGSPAREGYKFVGWFYHGVKFDMNTKINQDYVLVAKWIKA